MLSAASEVDHNAVCHTSYWRPLHDGSDHPSHYLMLGAKEVAELMATGAYHFPEDIIPESVLAWRKLQEGALDVLNETVDIDLLAVLEERVDAVRNGRA